MKQNIFAGRAVKRAGFALLGAAVLVVMGCFYMPALAGGKGTARARFVSQLPSNLTGELTLIIGGPGMETIVNQYPLGTLTSGPLSIPSGVARTFTLLANTPSVTLIGQQTTDLAPGETRDINLTFVAGGSQIIVPDYNNYRLVQIADMAGTGWRTDLSDFSGLHDVDFDDQGRIYFSSYSQIYQMDDIGAGYTNIANAPLEETILSLAFDRPRNLLYFTTDHFFGNVYDSELCRVVIDPVNGVGLVDVIATGVTFHSTGIAVDPDGFVYVADSFLQPGTVVKLKVDPSPAKTATVVGSYSDSAHPLSHPWDVLVNGGNIYVSDNGGPSIVRLTKDLQFVDSFGGPAPGTDPSQELVGPERFVAILNKPITVIDEDGSGTVDRLVSFNDMTGAGWKTFGSTGFGQDQFQFYNTFSY